MSKPAYNLELTPEEYLRCEHESDVRHEYVSGRIFAMVGSTAAHNSLNMNLNVLIGSNVRSSPCRAYANDMKVKVEATNSFYYPDLVVTCEPYSAKSVYQQAPCLIVEILSESTATIDRREKLAAYKTIPSLNEHLLVYQDERRTELYRRQNGEWTAKVFTGGDRFELEPSAELRIPLSLDDVYRGVIDRT